MTFGYRDTYSMINNIKKSFSSIMIAAGGPHISTLQEKVLEECRGLDYGILLEGDVSFIELCSGNELATIPGLLYRDKEAIIRNEFKQFISHTEGEI